MEEVFEENDRIELKSTYRVSLAFILKRNARAILALVALGFIITLFFVLSRDLQYGSLGEIWDFILIKKILLGSLIGIVLLVRLFYDYLYWLRYDYFIERGRLHIESGVLIRQEASVPINSLCQFYLEKRWVDLILGTQDLVMKAAIGENQEVCRIEALKESHAKALKRFLIKQGEKGSLGSGLSMDNDLISYVGMSS